MNKYLKIKKRTYEIIEKAQNNDKTSKYFDLLILILIVSNTIAIVLESFNLLYTMYSTQFKLFEMFSVAVFVTSFLPNVITP